MAPQRWPCEHRGGSTQLEVNPERTLDPIPIGQAAAQLGLRTSALRYYDEQGLVTPARGHGGHRMYGPTELRRLAFIKIGQQLGLPLAAAAAVLDAPSPQWRQLTQVQLVELDQLIGRARLARAFLASALDCPADHPASECPVMIEALDRVLAGAALADIAPEPPDGRPAGDWWILEPDATGGTGMDHHREA